MFLFTLLWHQATSATLRRGAAATYVGVGPNSTESADGTRPFMSALPLKADKWQTSRYGRLVPKADICSAANCSLFDHPVGTCEQERTTLDACGSLTGHAPALALKRAKMRFHRSSC